MATIKDVAKEAKVSIATVSLVVHKHNRISPETSKRVNKAIKKLNYHPSRSGRRLVSKKTGNVGFILTEDHFLRSEPFYTRIFLGTEFEARNYEYYILLTTIPSDYNEKSHLPRFILEKNIDGVIIAGKVPSYMIDQIEKYDLPIAIVDYYPPSNEYPVVLIDNTSGGITATQFLIKKNHKNIGFIAGDIDHPSIYDRFRGYKMAMDAAGIQFSESNYVVDENYTSRENGYNAAKKLLELNNDVTAIFACNDAMAIGVMQYLKEKGIAVPKDISVIGFDDVEADLSLDPPLSTVRVPKYEMGIEVMKLMAELLKDKDSTKKKILVSVELIDRGSVTVCSEKITMPA
ncbi:MAG: LacI family DNA-binding transcriptional regulator [Ignavibacteriaceae bacterium]|nr:LacI family DNA-binding transcriptional regulator [Ignavibacteriaceae bacterium]